MALVVPLLAIVFLNVSVYMTARRQINAIELQMGASPNNAESPQQQDIVSRRLKGREAAIDVAIIIAVFFVVLSSST